MSRSLPLAVAIFSVSVIAGTAFGRQIRTAEKTIHYRNIHCNKKIDLESTDTRTVPIRDAHSDCRLAGFGNIRKITDSDTHSDRLDVNFSSACVKCGICLAVAERINDILLNVIQPSLSSNRLNKSEISTLMNAVCKESFRNYKLREIDGKRYICDDLPFSKIIFSPDNESWEKRLSDTCYEYLNETGAERLFEHWMDWRKNGNENSDLKTVLCRSDANSMMRDCRGIPDLDRSLTRLDDRAPSIKFSFECDCC